MYEKTSFSPYHRELDECTVECVSFQMSPPNLLQGNLQMFGNLTSLQNYKCSGASVGSHVISLTYLPYR